MEKKKLEFDSVASVASALESQDISIDFGDYILINGPPYRDQLQSISSEYYFGLEMRMEDIRSSIERKIKTESSGIIKFIGNLSETIEETQESFQLDTEVPSTILQNSKEKDYEANKLKIATLESIVGYFFNNLSTVNGIEEKFKSEIDSDYICGRYYETFKEIFWNHEFESLSKAKKEIESMKIKLKEKKEGFKKLKKNYDEQLRNLKVMIDETNERIANIAKEKEILNFQRVEFEKQVTQYQEERASLAIRKGSFENVSESTPRSGSSERSPRLNQAAESEIFRSLIDEIRQILSSKSPPEAASIIIDRFRDQVKNIDGLLKTDKAEIVHLKNKLESRLEAFEKYEIVKKNEMLLTQRQIDSELARVKKFLDANSRNLRESELLSYIRKKERDLKARDEEIKMIFNTIYSMQHEILDSIENYKFLLTELRRENHELKKNLKLLRMFATNVN